MKYLFFIIALATLTTSCELRSTNFDPDNQFLSEDEMNQIAVLDKFQAQHLTSVEYECRNYAEFVKTEYTYRRNSSGEWIIEGSIKNFATKAHFRDALLSISFYSESNELIGSEIHKVEGSFAPGDRSGYYFRTDSHSEAHSIKLKINQLQSVR